MSIQPLFGRDRELRVLDDVLERVNERGGALVVRGEAGIGKSALLATARPHAADHGMRVLIVTGVQSEATLPFSGLHQLLRPILGHVSELASRQRDALLAAFGMSDTVAPDLFLIALAALELLASERPSDRGRRVASRFGASHILALAQMARGVSALGAGRPLDAFEQLQYLFTAGEPAHHWTMKWWGLADFVEAAVRSHRHEACAPLVAELAALVEQTPPFWLHTVLRHARALLADDESAGSRFQEALSVDLKEPTLMTMNATKPVLEPEAQTFADATAHPPYLFDLGPIEGRTVVDQTQSGAIARPDVAIEDTTVPGGPSGEVSIRIMRPTTAIGPLPTIVYIHGAGWYVRTAL